MWVLVLSKATSYNLFVVAGDVTFIEVVNEVMRQLEGAYALIFKSPHYPNELIACKRGSTLILGVNVSNNTPVSLCFFYFVCVKEVNLIFCLYTSYLWYVCKFSSLSISILLLTLTSKVNILYLIVSACLPPLISKIM
jgi:hypothetical protein